MTKYVKITMQFQNEILKDLFLFFVVIDKLSLQENETIFYTNAFLLLPLKIITLHFIGSS